MRDSEGNLLAEFDIDIRGPLGSSNVHWLIECRDRPSQGAAPASWIEQLVGRRQRFNLDKVFAVSTTGFGPEAVKVAKEFGILIRTVTEVGDIASDFRVRIGTVLINDITRVDELAADLLDPKGRRALDFNVRETFLRPAGETVWRDFPGYAHSLIERNQDPGVHELRLADSRSVELKTGNETMTVANLRFGVQLTTSIARVRGLAARVYSEGDRSIYEEGDFVFETPRGAVRLKLELLRRQDRSELEVRVTEPLPEGYDSLEFAYGLRFRDADT